MTIKKINVFCLFVISVLIGAATTISHSESTLEDLEENVELLKQTLIGDARNPQMTSIILDAYYLERQNWEQSMSINADAFRDDVPGKEEDGPGFLTGKGNVGKPPQNPFYFCYNFCIETNTKALGCDDQVDGVPNGPCESLQNLIDNCVASGDTLEDCQQSAWSNNPNGWADACQACNDLPDDCLEYCEQLTLGTWN